MGGGGGGDEDACCDQGYRSLPRVSLEEVTIDTQWLEMHREDDHVSDR